jgi:hypothetical protein
MTGWYNAREIIGLRETLAYAELAAALKTGAGPDATRFFAGTQNAALAAALAMKFGCPNAALHKTKLKK